MTHMPSSLLFVLSLWTCVRGHSWLQCADYVDELSDEVQDFSFDSCDGYSRGYKDSSKATCFSCNAGDKATGSVGCQTGISDPISDNYDDEYPYPTYTPGSTYRLVWPAKNHGIDATCDPSSVDRAMAIYVNPQVNPSSDLSDLDDFDLVYDWHAESGYTHTGSGIDGVPYANCMAYCEDTDASPCFGDMVIPTDLFTQSGFYTFMWYWEFSTTYVSCWDAYVDVGGDVVTISPDSGDASAGSEDESEDSEEIVTWHAVFPLCYEGATFDEDTVTDTLDDLFSGIDAEFTVTNYSEHLTQDAFNLTTDTYVTNLLVVMEGFENGTACSRLVTAFGGSGTCKLCNGGASSNEFSSSSAGGSGGSDASESFMVALIVVLVIILVIVAAGIVYARVQKNKGNANSSGMSTHVVQSTSQKNIMSTS